MYWLLRIDPEADQTWKTYTLSLIAFSLVSCVVLYAIQRLQATFRSTRPTSAPSTRHLSFNTAASFVTNTNWQSYGGETTMSHLTQIGGLLVQHFVSAAVGMAVVVALIRGIARSRTTHLGNFWVDLVRGTSAILLPLAIVFASSSAARASSRTSTASARSPLSRASSSSSPAARSPRLLAIKQLGSNGGGFFNVELRPPVREPDAVLQLRRAVPHLRPRVRARRRLRQWS